MTQKTYSEVYGILNMLGNEYISKLPIALVELIKREKLSTYNPEYNLDIPAEAQDISEEALAMVTFFNVKYWANSLEKEEILEVLQENEKSYNEAKAKEINTEINVSNTNIEAVNKDNYKANEICIITPPKNIFKRIFVKIRAIFYRV